MAREPSLVRQGVPAPVSNFLMSCSCRCPFWFGPTELSPVEPHAMKDCCQPASDRDCSRTQASQQQFGELSGSCSALRLAGIFLGQPLDCLDDRPLGRC